MTLTSRSNKSYFKNKIAIQLDIYMYIGREEDPFHKSERVTKNNFIMVCTNKWVGVFPCSPCSFGAFELAIIGTAMILCSTDCGPTTEM